MSSRNLLTVDTTHLIQFCQAPTLLPPRAFAHCRYQLPIGGLEGFNNAINVVKCTAYGYRDEGYFFLNFRVAFPSSAR